MAIDMFRAIPSATGWRNLYIQSRATVKQQATELASLQDQLDNSAAEARGSRELLVRETEKNDEMRVTNGRMKERLEARVEGIVDYDGQEAWCTSCEAFAPIPDVRAIRHVAGTRIGELPCPYLLDMRALGRPVLDDSEEVD